MAGMQGGCEEHGVGISASFFALSCCMCVTRITSKSIHEIFGRDLIL